MKELTIHTSRHAEFVDITGAVQQAVSASGLANGLCTVLVPHTTAGITINENADPDVTGDMLLALDKAVPWRAPHYRHDEGNSAAHVKASLMGHSVQVLVTNGRLHLGTWQGIYFCEFDGPRSRHAWVHVAGA